MNSIIPGYVFYLIDLFGSLQVIAIITAIALAIMVAVSVSLFTSECFIYGSDDEDAKKYMKLTKIGITALLVSCLTVAVIPSKTTMYTMLVNSYVTENNIEMAGNTAREVVDYIFDKLAEIK